MGRVVVAEFMDEDAVRRLASKHDVHYGPELGDDRSALLEVAAGSDAIVVRNKTRVDHSLIDAAGRLRMVGRLGVGLDNIDVDACRTRGVEVYTARGANTLAVAEYVIGTLFVLLRGMLDTTDAILAGAWPRAATGGELSGTQLGLIGFGTIARAVATRATVLGMELVACDPFLRQDDPAWQAAKRVELEQLLRTSGAVSIHVPLSPDTENLLSASALARMRPGAFLINTSRGGVVDESAVVQGLRDGTLGGAALDVFDQEPPDPHRLAEFATAPNLLLTPHIAGITLQSNQRVGAVIADKLLEVLDG